MARTLASVACCMRPYLARSSVRATVVARYTPPHTRLLCRHLHTSTRARRVGRTHATDDADEVVRTLPPPARPYAGAAPYGDVKPVRRGQAQAPDLAEGEIDLTQAGEFMIKSETEFLDKAADNAAVRETLQMLESAGKAEAEVLGKAWDLLAKLGAKRPTEGPGSQPMPEEESPADDETSS